MLEPRYSTQNLKNFYSSSLDNTKLLGTSFEMGLFVEMGSYE